DLGSRPFGLSARLRRDLRVRLGLALFASLATACGSSEERQGVGSSPTDPGQDAPRASEGAEDQRPAPRPDKPGCAGDAYTEALPTKATLSDLAFSEDTANDFLVAALERRYPIGKELVEGGLASTFENAKGNCIDRYLEDRSSAGAVLCQAGTI